MLRAHLSQYLESEIVMAISREITREMVATAPPRKTISAGEDVCILEIAATMLIDISYDLLRLKVFLEDDSKDSPSVLERTEIGISVLSSRFKGGHFLHPETCFFHTYGLFCLNLKSL